MEATYKWHPIAIGQGFEERTLPLGTDEEGPVFATLVRRLSDEPSRTAVLYVHGYNDYFFQVHLAAFYTSKGINFYALDLRKYGRSIRDYQTPYFCRDLVEYFTDLDRAVEIIRNEDNNSALLLNAHSLGGLIGALWAHNIRADGILDAIFLNSPLLDFRRRGSGSQLLRFCVQQIAGHRPEAELPLRPAGGYARSLHTSYGGRWEFNQSWKSTSRPRFRFGVLAAIDRGLHDVRQGLQIEIPILVMCPRDGVDPKKPASEILSGDAVIDPDHIAQICVLLGRHVTCIRVKGAVHDLLLSEPTVQDVVFQELTQWLGAFFLK